MNTADCERFQNFESTTSDPDETLLFALLILVVIEFPLKWKKTSWGDEVEWVVYFINLRTHSLELSERRANWAVSWCNDLARAGAAKISDLRDGLWRLSFAVGALERERPFLAPLFAFVAKHPTSAVRPLPLFVRLRLPYLARCIAAKRLYCCATQRAQLQHAPRVDAHAGDEVGIGDWLPRSGPDGRINRRDSPWFS